MIGGGRKIGRRADRFAERLLRHLFLRVRKADGLRGMQHGAAALDADAFDQGAFLAQRQSLDRLVPVAL